MGSDGEPILKDGDIYLEKHQGKLGTGDTERNSVIETYWVAHPKGDGMVLLELLDMNHQPSGYKETVDMAEFAKRFRHVPDFHPEQLSPKERQADRHSARAERHLAEQEFLSAEYEFNRSLKVDEQNVRANFGLGQTYVAMGEPEKAKEQFKKLVEIDALLDPRHKHIFNEFGMQLRKLGMFAEAVKHYHKALQIERCDENLWFNLGRALIDGGLAEKGKAALDRALKINPNMPEAKVLLAALEKKGR